MDKCRGATEERVYISQRALTNGIGSETGFPMRNPLLNCFSDLRQRLFYCSGVGHLECGTVVN